jgi:hypothetical protein
VTVDLSDYNPLDEKWRWCYYCKADCWPEPENQQHGSDCPMVTGLWPITEQDEDPWTKGFYSRCCTCSEPFNLGDTYVLVDVETDKASRLPDCGEVTCVGCAVAREVHPAN